MSFGIDMQVEDGGEGSWSIGHAEMVRSRRHESDAQCCQADGQ